MNTQTNGANAQSCCSTSSCCPSQPSRRAQPKVGRNDPCPCGNGRKFKKCCGRSL
ncbi:MULTISPECIES: SEC-C metal-binding domain-containing protein [Spongiibacter]|uniref:SEC-C metal-binding domain-containing protein n=1 Tax=Spongiibacter TaxID=630749 RepID=UPI0032E4827E